MEEIFQNIVETHEIALNSNNKTKTIMCKSNFYFVFQNFILSQAYIFWKKFCKEQH